MPMVPGFQPSVSGFHFINSFHSPSLVVNILTKFGNVDIANASFGFCGGMAFAARDFFESNLVTPPDSTPPSPDTPLYTYLLQRLITSFNGLVGTGQYYWLMDPGLPDHETDASKLGLAPHGRAWVMIVQEWPKIKATIDSGRLCPIGLVLVKSLSPADLRNNHVILVYGYDLNGTDLVLHVYDSNKPDDDNVTLSLSIADPNSTTQVTYSPDPTINCFFHLDYSHVDPPQNAAFSGQNVPSAMDPGHSYPVTITMTNTGVTTWIAGGNNPYRLGSQNPQDNSTWGLQRVDVPGVIGPGAPATFNFNVTAPAVAGFYQFQWRMLQEGITWFGDFTPNIHVNVGATIKVPNLLGQSPSSAKSIAQQAGLGMLITGTVVGGEVPTVSSQQPAPGTLVPPRTTIDVVVLVPRHPLP